MRAYTFDRAGIPVAVLWDWEEDGDFATLDVALDPLDVAAFDMMGNPIELVPSGPTSFLLPLGNLPVYLEGDGVAVDFAVLSGALQAAVGSGD